MILNWLTDWKFWGALAEAIFLLALTYNAWLRRHDGAVKDEIESGDSALGEKLTAFDQQNHDKIKRVHVRIDSIVEAHNAHGHRLTKVESEVRNLPSHTDIGILHKKMGSMQKEVTKALTVANQTKSLVETINAYLMQKD